MSPSDLVEILEQARRNNARLQVSGMLLHANGTFLQVLEGDPEVVESLYSIIEEDRRHVDLRILLREQDVERSFGDWTMGFVRADREMIDSVPGLNDFLQAIPARALPDLDEADRVRKILEGFKTGRWRREIAGE